MNSQNLTTSPNIGIDARFVLLARLAEVAIFVLLLRCEVASCETLYFLEMADAQGHISQSWFSVGNWYSGMSNGMWIAAGHTPLTNDNAMVMSSPVQCGGPPIVLNTLTLQGGITVEGGSLSVLKLNTLPSLGANPTFSGATVEVQSEFDVGAPFTGVTTFTGSTLVIDVGASNVIAAGATLDMQNSVLINKGQIILTSTSTLQFGGGLGAANQFSILTNAVLSGTGTNSVVNDNGPGLLFDNNGTVRGDGGKMVIALGNCTWTNSLGLGTYSTSVSNAVIEFYEGTYTIQRNNTNQFLGPGLIWFFNNLTVTNNGILRVGNHDPTTGTVQWDAALFGTGITEVVGSPGLPSQFIWDGGSINGPMMLDVDAWSQLLLTSANRKTLSAATINNAGSATWLNGPLSQLALDNGAVFNNLSNAVFQAWVNTEITGGAGTNLNLFYNAGTFRKSTNVNNLQFTTDAAPNPGPYFINTGLLDVQTGRLLLLGGTNSGQFNVAAGAQLEFQANYTQNPGASFTGAGLVMVDQTLRLNTPVSISDLMVANVGIVDGPGDLTITGSLTANGGTFQGSGAINIASNATCAVLGMNLSRNVTNAGVATLGNAAVVASLTAGANIIWNNQPGSSLQLFGASTMALASAGLLPSFNNAGTVGNAVPASGASINWPFNNSGLVLVSSNAVLSFNNAYIQTGGNTVVSSRGTLNLRTGFGANILGGLLSDTGTVSGDVTNSGTIHPGDSPGILTINGDVVNGPRAVLAIELAGTNAGAQYSQLVDTGSPIWLTDTTLALSFDNGFIPSVGQSFIIWTNGPVNGAFGKLLGTPTNGIAFVARYGASSVTLLAAHDPEPSMPVIQGTNCSFSFQSTAGITAVVQHTDALNPPNWQVLTQFVGDGSLKTIVDHLAGPGTRFFRIGLK